MGKKKGKIAQWPKYEARRQTDINNQFVTLRGHARPTAGSHYGPQWTEATQRVRTDTSAQSHCAAQSPETSHCSTWLTSQLALVKKKQKKKQDNTDKLAMKNKSNSCHTFFLQGTNVPFDPTAMSWFLEAREKHEAQWGSAIFLIICRKTQTQSKA